MKKLPKHGQEIWQAAFNAAFEEYDGEEGKSRATAWAAAKAKYEQDAATGEWHVKEQQMSETPETILFFSDLSKREYPIKFERADGKQVVKGLPVIRVGRWKGHDYTPTELQQYVDNTNAMRAEQGWDPPMRSKHVELDANGVPKPTDSRDTLGFWSGLRFDSGTQTILGDVEVGDDAARGIQQGTMRYLSAELSSGFPLGGKTYDKVFSGAATVEHPAVPGMPWSLVLNSEDFPQSVARQDVHLSLGSLSADQVRNKAQEILEGLPPYNQGQDNKEMMGPRVWVRELFEGYLVAEWEGETYRHKYSVKGAEVTVDGQAEKVVQSWSPPPVQMAETTEAAGMKESVLPGACFLIPETRNLPYRDADTSGDKDAEGRYTKAGLVNCGRVRNIASVLKGGRGSKITPGDLSEAAVTKLKAAAKACGSESEVIAALSESKIQGGERRMSNPLLDSIKGIFTHAVQEVEKLEEAPAVPPELVALQEQNRQTEALLAEEKRRGEELHQLAEGRALAAYGEHVAAQVKALLDARQIMPAQEKPLVTILRALRGQEVVTLAEDGKTEVGRQEVAELLLATLRGGAAISREYFEQVSKSTAPDAEVAVQTEVDRIAATVG